MTRSPETITNIPLTLQMFGTCEARVNGQPLPPLRYRKDLWILMLLALRHDREVARDWLAFTFWPDASESQALYYLRRSLSNLRSAFGTEAARLLSPTPRTLRLDLAGAFSDVLAFDRAIAASAGSASPVESLQEAVALYRGPLLPDCPEDWALIERNAREQAYFAALERLARIMLQRGEQVAAIRWLRLLLAADPYRESACCTLMQALSDAEIRRQCFRFIETCARHFGATLTRNPPRKLKRSTNAFISVRFRMSPYLPLPLPSARLAVCPFLSPI